MCDIPVITLPTTAGTGSRGDGGAVLTRNDIHTKNRHESVAVPGGFPLWTRDISRNLRFFLLDTGVIDALAHGVKLYTPEGSSVCRGKRDEPGNIQNSVSAVCGVQGSSARRHSDGGGLRQDRAGVYDSGSGVYAVLHLHPPRNGISVITLLRYMSRLILRYFSRRMAQNFKDQTLIQDVIQDCGFENSDEFADYVRALTNRDVNLEVTDSEISSGRISLWSSRSGESGIQSGALMRGYLDDLRQSLAKYIKKIAHSRKKYKKRNFMENRYKHSLSRVKIGNVEIKNRYALAPIGTGSMNGSRGNIQIIPLNIILREREAVWSHRDGQYNRGYGGAEAGSGKWSDSAVVCSHGLERSSLPSDGTHSRLRNQSVYADRIRSWTG